MERSESSIRMFKDSDYEWLIAIACLNNHGMRSRDIKRCIERETAGDSNSTEGVKQMIR